MRAFAAAAAFVVLANLPALAAEPVHVVAAENFYGDIAKQIGGPTVKVTSILSAILTQDPHLFEASPSVARSLQRRTDRHLQRHRLRPVDGGSAQRVQGAGPQDDRRRRSHRQEVR